MNPESDFPRWLTELYLALAGYGQFVVTGNVRDYHVIKGIGSDGIDTKDALHHALDVRGINTVFTYMPVDGLSVKYRPENRKGVDKLIRGLTDEHGVKLPSDEVEKLLGDATLNQSAPVHSKRLLGALMSLVATASNSACALILDYATWLIPEGERGTSGSDSGTEAVAALRNAHTLGATAIPRRRGLSVPPDERPPVLYNPIIWITRGQSDLPTWFLATPGLRIVSIEQPGRDMRREYGRIALKRWDKFRVLRDGSVPDRERVEQVIDLFSDVTEGFTLRQSRDIINVAKDRKMELHQLPAAQFAYRVGVVESEWEKPRLRADIRENKAYDFLAERVLGQRGAVTKASEIVQRAALGLAGAETAGTNPRRPKGVLFLAGPTGTGKTLLAKTIAELVFRSKDNFVRFDMSEYSQEHAEARLIGSPPGYTGYSAGGQLTEAVRQRPFTLLLFDEVEKAHPLILDKFLQVLDEGRLTDGTGMTVNFSETIIVFTSNLGIELDRDELGRVVGEGEPMTYGKRFPAGDDKGISFAEMEFQVRESVEKYFRYRLRRPELLNRIGQGNIVVFDFIDRGTGRDILDGALSAVGDRLQAKLGAQLLIDPIAGEQLANAILTDRTLAMGGRGVNSAVEELLVNPLSRDLAGRLDERGQLSHTQVCVARCVVDPRTQRTMPQFTMG